MQGYEIDPIGVVRSSVKQAALVYQESDLRLHQQAMEKQMAGDDISEIIIEESCMECLDGIEDFSHVQVLYWPHRLTEEGRRVTRVHPAGIKDFPLVGVFATRSPARPNPILTTTVQLLERKDDVLLVKGLDAIDGSPIIDIKPYVPVYDTPSEILLPDWCKTISECYSTMISQHQQ